ncbi:MAG: hypothetical protein KME60_23080 [Cyanomargarita calcarea GSE-NOS-MK-12-04C]|jgi:hypothetical protein|uniref:Uncharacterized protein n=1 Tax=Cyanomargarita calcarea GSE-NOS-MK-12-04C TaxID=2839659 RepID=A0A951UWX0_9CYAN|nr:hypothetical protein [Cyanomargarita calcarea GSE-NOS-MK-12-04C]
MNSSLLENGIKSPENVSTINHFLLEAIPELNITEDSESAIFEPEEQLQNYEVILEQHDNSQYILPSVSTTHTEDSESLLPNLRNPLYQKLSQNASSMTKSHAAFLQARQESLHQISALIQLQMDFCKQLFP